MSVGLRLPHHHTGGNGAGRCPQVAESPPQGNDQESGAGGAEERLDRTWAAPRFPLSEERGAAPGPATQSLGRYF